MGDSQSRQDRELIELLNELRVALPGVQVLFAFLLTVPFTSKFATISQTQKSAYFISLLGAAAASAFLIAPSAFHRIEFRAKDKERLVVISNVFALIGIVFLAVAVISAVFLITNMIYGGTFSILVTGVVAVLFSVLWFVIPVYRRSRVGWESR